MGLLGLLCFLAGHGAVDVAQGAPRAARTSLGAGFWIAALAAALCWGEAAGRLGRGPAGRTVLGLLGILPPAFLLADGWLDQLSVMREYRARQEEFAAAAVGHLHLVGVTLLIAIPLGLATGLLAQRHRRWRGAVFAVLNVVQTIPSIALFGLLLAPLAAIGIGGIGTPPAIIALTLYSLLPLARTTVEGLDGVPPAIRESAQGMGMGPWRVLMLVEVPLALPALLAGIRITAVQAIGLAVIAALIGAGGFGTLLFEGLSANALDLVVLGVVPRRAAGGAGRRRAADPRVSDGTPGVITLEAITRRYGASTAVDAVSLEIPGGAFCVLIGTSGSGSRRSCG